MAKIRIDKYLIDKNYFDDIDVLKRYIMAGKVYINENKITSGALKYNEEEIKNIKITKKTNPFASRGGLKLQKAIEYWNIDFKNKVVLDVGSSTGGFCSCALHYGAKKVYALDVGTNQLSYELRINPQIEVFEQTNFRTLEKDFFKEKFDIITMDVSFISVKLLLKNVSINLKENGFFICLIKPQFEADKNIKRNKKGVLSDLEVHKTIIEDIKKECVKNDLKLIEYITSPIKGAKGNVEYLALIKPIKKEEKNV